MTKENYNNSINNSDNDDNNNNNVIHLPANFANKFIVLFFLNFSLIVIWIVILIGSSLEDDWKPANIILWLMVGIMLIDLMLIKFIISCFNNNIFPPLWAVYMDHFLVVISLSSVILPSIIAAEYISKLYVPFSIILSNSYLYLFLSLFFFYSFCFYSFFVFTY